MHACTFRSVWGDSGMQPTFNRLVKRGTGETTSDCVPDAGTASQHSHGQLRLRLGQVSLQAGHLPLCI